MTSPANDSHQQPVGHALDAPWTLRFERNGTEDFAIISESDGADLLYSRDFWLPEPRDAVPGTLTAMRVIVAAPQLLAACQMVIDRWEHGDLAEAARACQAAVALATAPYTR